MVNSYFTICCMHSLGIGSLFSYWSIFREKTVLFFSKLQWIVLSIIFYFIIHYIAFFKNCDWEKNILDTFLFALISVMIINYAAQNKFNGIFKHILENRLIVYSGKISYGMYVFHLFMPYLFHDVICPKLGIEITNKYIAFLVYYITLFFMAHVSWKLIENPVNNLKIFFPYFKPKG